MFPSHAGSPGYQPGPLGNLPNGMTTIAPLKLSGTKRHIAAHGDGIVAVGVPPAAEPVRLARRNGRPYRHPAPEYFRLPKSRR
jgi:hypothetical protein